MTNIIMMTDSYKCSHWKQYPKDTNTVYSYWESRGGEFPSTCFFGLQYFIKKYLLGQVVTPADIKYARSRIVPHVGEFNEDGWYHIWHKHNGYLPIEIKAVPEGSIIPTSNVLMTVQNTDPECYWLTNYLETILSQIWYPTTVATQSYYMKKNLEYYLNLTGHGNTDFKLHDFGYRGVSSHESAGLGGAAHLIHFMGTDTLAGIEMAYNYYDEFMAGNSIPASEHSTITAWGEDNEVDAMRNMLEQYPTGLVACVSDSFDIYNACNKIWGEELKDKVLERDGTLVIRPDSGDPLVVIPKVLKILGDQFGYTLNTKGFKVLHHKVRIIQGDGIDRRSMKEILEIMTIRGWSADNITFGSGGGLLQKLNRDTCKFAFKCSAVNRNDRWHDVYKNPVTDQGKQSKRGRLKLIKKKMGDSQAYSTVRKTSDGDDLLETVFFNGKITRRTTFKEIRNNVS